MIKAAKWTLYGALFLIPVLPLLVADGIFFPNLFFPFITGKGFAFRILVEIALAAYVFLAVAEPRYRPRFSWTLAAFSALTLWMAVANLFAVNVHKAFWSNFERMDGWIVLVHTFIFFVIAGSVLSADKLWRRWWTAFLAVAAVVCAYSLFQIMGVSAIHQGGVRVDASFGNAAYLAAYLLFVIAVALWQAFESKGYKRYALLALTGVSLIVLFFTATRGAILGLVGSAILAAFLWMIESGKKGRIIAGSALVALFIIVGGFITLRDTPFVTNDPTLARIGSISTADGSTRFTLWHMALEGVAERPLVGWGQEGFNYIFNSKYEPSLYAQEAWFDRAHNTFIDWLVAGGIPALVFFLGLLGSGVWALYRSNVSRPERIILIAALAAYSFQALFVFDNLFTYVPLAALLALAHTASARNIKRIEDMPVPSENTLQTIVGPVVLVVGLATVWMVNIPSMVAASDLVYAVSPSESPSTNLAHFKHALAANSFASQEIREQLLAFASQVTRNPGVTDADKSAFLTYALQEMSQEIQAIPHDARLHLEYAMGLRTAGLTKEALTEDEAALALSPKKQTLMIQKGIDLWQTGDTAGAADIFKQAYALDTSFSDVALYVVAGSIIMGDTESANKLLLDSFGTTTVDSNTLMSAYYQVKNYPELTKLMELHAKTSNSAEEYYRLAVIYALSNRRADAQALVQKTMTDFPASRADGVQLLQKL